MSRNEIRLDQIQQRLGSSNKQRPAQYDDYGYPIPQMPSRGESGSSGNEGSTLNAGFIATIIAASLTVGMGTFFFIGGDTPDLGLNLSWGSGGGSGGWDRPGPTGWCSASPVSRL